MNQLIDILNQKFVLLHEHSCELIQKIPNEKLYWQPREKEALFPVNSCGEYILRSAGAVEQTFGGITVKLWDDPFEWTLPEQLSTNKLVLEYLAEVEETRQRGFTFFKSDEDLKKTLRAPVKMLTIFELLLNTLTKAENHQGRAIGVFRLFSDEKVL